MRFRPSIDLLNLRNIELKLSKQKNYTECETVRKDIKKLTRQEEIRFLKGHQQKIETKCVIMAGKQKLEIEALEVKLDRIYKEQDKLRKI